MDAIELYHYSLQQEVLDETISNELNRLIVYMCKHGISENDSTEYSKLFWELTKFEKTIISDDNNNDNSIQNITKQIEVFRKRIDEVIAKSKNIS